MSTKTQHLAAFQHAKAVRESAAITNTLWRLMLASTVWAEDQGLRYRIPGLEAAVANKYGAMLTLGRDPGKRLQDAADFTKMVQHSTEKGQQALDLTRLRDLGEMVWPGGGGKEIIDLVEQVKQGKVVNVNGLMGSPGQ